GGIVTVDPNEVQNLLLPIVDRWIAPVAQRLDQIDERPREDTRRLHNKLDRLAPVANGVQSHAVAVGDGERRMEGVGTAQVAQRLDQMDERQREDTRTLHNKLDQLAAVAHRVQSHDDAVDDLKGRMEGVETVQVAQQAAMNKMTGRNEVIMWLLGGIGGP